MCGDKNIISPINFTEICSVYGCRTLLFSNETVIVNPGNNTALARSSLLPCSKFFQQNLTNINRVTGYFKNRKWNPLLCSHSLDSIKSLLTPLKNKVVYFFGDSTIRQFFMLVSSKLGMKIEGPDSKKIWQQPKIARTYPRQANNITMYYRAHGPPLRNPGPPNTRPYISDSILGISVGGQDVLVIFNVGAHFYQHHPSFYIHRIRGIRTAIEEHHKVFPETRFIVRGLNVVEHADEWSIYRLNRLLRETFHEMKNVLFLNLWDLTTVWPLDVNHPDKETLVQETLLMFGHVVS